MPARSRFTLPVARRARPRWLVASAVVHGVLVLALLAAYRGFVQVERDAPAVIAVGIAAPRAPRRPRAAPPPPRGRPVAIPRASAPLVVPATIPGPTGEAAGVRGGVLGGEGLALGPVRGDARLWVRPLYVPEDGGRPIDMDSVVRGRLLGMAALADSMARRDSLSPGANPYATPRWTFERNGRTYGIDAQGIHFGSFTIPTMVLALLPFPQGNIDQARANARLMEMRADILRAAARAEAEEDFRRAVAQIRERKDRERREERARRARERPSGDDRPIP